MKTNQAKRGVISVGMFRLGLLYLRHYGWRRFSQKLVEKIRVLFGLAGQDFSFNNQDYRRWIANNEPSITELDRQRHQSQSFANQPLISIIVPLFRTDRRLLTEMIESVKSQTYASWELCLAASEVDDIRDALNSYAQSDNRIRVRYLSNNEGMAGNSNRALAMVKGEYIALLDHDDLLAPFALFEVIKSITSGQDPDVIYSDEDKIDSTGRRRHSPHFKPDWNPDLLRSFNYITHLFVVKRGLANVIGGFRSGFEGCQDYDLILRATEKVKRIVHIPKVLYHWRQHLDSTAININAKDSHGIEERTIQTVREHLSRIHRTGEVQPGPFFGSVRIRYQVENDPSVSIIIPTSDHSDLLDACLKSIKEKTDYRNYEVIVVENGSRDKKTFSLYERYYSWEKFKLLTWDKPFNYSAINNAASKEAKGEYYLFLNNDITVISPDWINELIGHCQWPEVSAAGAKLYYPDGSIQHAGVIVGLGGTAGHIGKLFKSDAHGYFGRLRVVQDLSAVTGACLMVKAAEFRKIGGFDEQYPLSFNDIDLCLRLIGEGGQVVWTPYAQLYHHESKTRGFDDTTKKRQRLDLEEERFRHRWPEALQSDSNYNPNLDLQRGNFSVRLGQIDARQL